MWQLSNSKYEFPGAQATTQQSLVCLTGDGKFEIP